LKFLSITQGLYFFFTGIWPLLSIRTFQIVTGPKIDLWLVKTVGVLVIVIGSVLMAAGIREQITPETILLAVGGAASLASIDVVYVLKGRISPVYLLDALIEMIFIIGWILAGAI
jgi:hypothetical protein